MAKTNDKSQSKGMPNGKPNPEGQNGAEQPRQLVLERLAEIKVGELIAHENLALLPLYAGNGHPLPYLLLKDAIQSGMLVVTEVSEGGSVPNLKVTNKSDKPVLILAGEELVGAKQNRIVNVTIVVAAFSDLVVPVSCVERGRWSYQSARFRSGRHAHHSLRHQMTRSVRHNIKASGVYCSDQQGVWASVDALHAKFATHSETSAMDDSFEKTATRLSAFKDRLRYPSKAAGVALFINGSIAGIELFEHPQILESVWDTEIESYAIDAIDTSAGKKPATPFEAQFAKYVKRLTASLEPPRKSVGSGYDVGIEQPDLVGAALVNDHKVVHLLAFVESASAPR